MTMGSSVVTMTERRVVAVQDLDCIDRVKFRYALPIATPTVFLDQFSDATVTIHAFSRITSRARDLFSITKSGFFRCDGIVGGDEVVTAFEGDPLHWPAELIADFDRRLRASGFSAIDYVRGEPIDCAACPARFEKRCRGGAMHGETPADRPGARPQA